MQLLYVSGKSLRAFVCVRLRSRSKALLYCMLLFCLVCIKQPLCYVYYAYSFNVVRIVVFLLLKTNTYFYFQNCNIFSLLKVDRLV